MAPALAANAYIFEGVWTNWSHGRVLGLTLTVSPQKASILSPALAILVSVAGAQLWRLFQYALHQARVASEDRNLVYHQSQAILRNTGSDLNTLWRLTRLGIAWRHQRGARIFRNLSPILVPACIHLTLVIAAGLFSSWLLEAGTEALSRSPWCGMYSSDYINRVYYANRTTDPESAILSTEYNTYTDSRYALVEQTTDLCGGAEKLCGGTVRDELPYSTNFIGNVCPVDDSMCHPDAGGSMTFDTGYLSSHKMLGYNARLADRVSVRTIAQCSPLKADGYVSQWQNSTNKRQVSYASYGQDTANEHNATFSVTKMDLGCQEKQMRTPFLLLPQQARPGGNGKLITSTYTPSPELVTTDSDLSLISLSYQNSYGSPVIDPWFSAQVATNLTDQCSTGRRAQYARDYPVTVMACTQQWQLCDNDQVSGEESDHCTALMGYRQLKSQLLANSTEITLNARQNTTAQRILLAATQSSFYYMVYSLSNVASIPLKAKDMVYSPSATNFPSTQWHTEITYWMSLIVNYFQQANLDYSTGQFAASTDYIAPTTRSNSTSPDPEQDAAYALCQNQMINTDVYRNFNFFAMLLLVVICLIITVAGLVIEDLVGYLRQRKLQFSGANSRQDMWIANSDLDMLRRIDELKNGTRWTLSKNGFPVTHVGHKINVYDLLTENHTVEKDVGLVFTDVQRVKSKKSTSPSSDGHEHKSRHCVTCESLATTRQNSQENLSSIEEPSPHSDPVLKYQNEFQWPFSRGTYPTVDTPYSRHNNDESANKSLQFDNTLPLDRSDPERNETYHAR